METQIFYWTGVTVWWTLCFGCILLVSGLAIGLPAYFCFSCKKKIWTWMWAAKIAQYGYSQDDLIYAYSVPDSPLAGKLSPSEIVEWLGMVKERADKLRTK